MVIQIEKYDPSTGYAICSSHQGTFAGRWCTETAPQLLRTYDIEIDVPEIVPKQAIQFPVNPVPSIGMQSNRPYVCALVVDQEDHLLTLQLGSSLLMVEVDFTADVLCCLRRHIMLSLQELRLYDTHTL